MASPVASFGYGDFQVRFKVKKGVKFISTYSKHFWLADQCSEIPEVERDNTIAYGYFKSDTIYFEYQACSPKVFESWSYDTKENLVEMIRDYRWIRYHEEIEKYQFNLYYGTDFQTRDYVAYLLKSPFHSCNIDMKDFSLSNFIRVIIGAQDRVRNNPGRVYTQDHQSLDQNHYQGVKKIWFHD